MDNSRVSFPDCMLRLTRRLPDPISDKSFYLLRTLFRAVGQKTGAHTRIRFGTVEISAPLDHPAVYWRYLPESFNRNYLALTKEVVAGRDGFIVDVGANIGDGVALLRGAGVNAPIVAVEGAEIWFDLLKCNTRELHAVELEQALLGSGDNSGFTMVVREGSGKLVRSTSEAHLTTLDELLKRYEAMPIALLKTDTDGFDVQVLLGAKGILTDQTPVLFVEVDEGLLRPQGNCTEELLEYLRRCGYADLAAWDNYGEWLATRPISDGLQDLVDRYHGGPNAPYLDVAFFSSEDNRILKAVEKIYCVL